MRRRALVCGSDPEEGALLVGVRDDLQPDRQALGEAAGDRDPGKPGDVHRQREDVVEVHRERVVHFRADLERDRRRGRRHQRVHLLEDAVVLTLDQRPDLLRLDVVGVVVTGRKRVRTEDHAPLHLGPEAGAACALVGLDEIAALDAQSVSNAVVPREVRRRLRGLDDVVDGESLVGEGEGHLLKLRALALEHPQRVAHGALPAGVDPGDREMLLRHAEPQAADALVEVTPEIVGRKIDHRRVIRVLAEERLAHDGDVLHGVRERADLVERGRERDHAPSRDAPVRGLHADDAAERCRLADGSAGVRAEREEHLASGDRDRGSARRPTRDTVFAPRVLDRSERGVLVRASHGELVEVCLADHHRAVRVETLDHGRGVRRDVALEDARPRGRRDALRADDVLARPGDAAEERRAVRSQARVSGLRLGPGVLVGPMQPRVVAVVVRAGKREVGELERRRLALAQQVGRLADRPRQLPAQGLSSSTGWTRKNWPSWPPRGALRSTSSSDRPARIWSSRMTLATGSTEAVGETSEVSTSLSRSTARSTTDSCPVKRSTSSGVSAMRASAAAFSTTERSMAMTKVYGPTKRNTIRGPKSRSPTQTAATAPTRTPAAATSFAAFASGCVSGEASVTASSSDVFSHSRAMTNATVSTSAAHSSVVRPSR